MAVRIPKALAELIQKQVPPIRKAFLEGVQNTQNDTQIKALIERLKQNDLEGAYQTIRIDPKQFAGLGKEFSKAYWNGGTAVTGSINKAVLSVPVLPFDGTLPRAEDWVKTHSSDLITNIVDEQKTLAKFVLQKGLAAGANPEMIARDLVGRINRITRKREGGFIGLTEKQTKTVLGVRDKLGSGNPEDLRAYLNLKLRDRRFDNTVNNALKSGKALKKSQIANISTRYEARSLMYRGNLIASNEATIAIENGRAEAFSQMVEDGSITKEQIRTYWRHTFSRDPRKEHIAMDGKSVAFGVSFHLPDGTVMKYPHDPAGGPKMNLNCHCYADHVVGPKP